MRLVDAMRLVEANGAMDCSGSRQLDLEAGGGDAPTVLVIGLHGCEAAHEAYIARAHHPQRLHGPHQRAPAKDEDGIRRRVVDRARATRSEIEAAGPDERVVERAGARGGE